MGAHMVSLMDAHMVSLIGSNVGVVPSISGSAVLLATNVSPAWAPEMPGNASNCSSCSLAFRAEIGGETMPNKVAAFCGKFPAYFSERRAFIGCGNNENILTNRLRLYWL